MNFVLRAGVFWLLALASWMASAQEIYVCTDSKGRRLTSDRPIADCLDREQKVFGSSGMQVRTLGPSLTAQEREVQEEAQKHEAQEQARLADEKRRDRALLTRYPNPSAHERERVAALVQFEQAIQTSHFRLQELAKQRKTLDAEMEFYQQDPNKAPGALKRKIKENTQSVAAQQRFLADQDDEKNRINQRFDEERVKLTPRWTKHAAPVTPRAPP